MFRHKLSRWIAVLPFSLIILLGVVFVLFGVGFFLYAGEPEPKAPSAIASTPAPTPTPHPTRTPTPTPNRHRNLAVHIRFHSLSIRDICNLGR